MSYEQQAPRETLKEHALRLIREIQECPESMGSHCIDVLCDELEPLIRTAHVTSPADLAPVAQPPIAEKWDKSGLKDACKRALKLGRTHQETDIQLFLDMLLEIERLESAVTTAQQRGAELQREVDLEMLASEVVGVCDLRGWSLHWTHRGAYLHLEASELIEAVRGKRGSIAAEGGDVLFVLLSILKHNGVPIADAITAARNKVQVLKTKPRYAGEEFTGKGAG